MAADFAHMTGAQRAAVLLLSVGEEDAAAVLKFLDARDVQVLGTAMASLQNVSRDDANRVLAHFAEELEQQTPLGLGTDEYVRKVLIGALGETKAGSLIDRILTGRNSKGLESLRWMESRSIAEMVGQEHPQIIALILAYLEPDHAAKVLGYLPDRVAGDALMRIATLDGVQPHALRELDEIMERQFSGNTDKLKSTSMGGLKAAANILNNMESSREAELMGAIRTADADLGEHIEELMFTFEDLVRIDDRNLQILLREIPSARLVIALKGTDQALREKFFGNMSQHAADMLRDDLEVAGPVRLSDVDAAQKEVLALARKLADAGTIVLGSNEEMV